MYDPSLGDPAPQIHDFNPGITRLGVFWTSIVDNDDVRANIDKGRATLEVRNLRMKDFFNLQNATVGGGPRPVAAVVSYKVVWNALGAVNSFDNAEQKFRGEFRSATAQMEWSARTRDFTFVSAPLATSTTDAAQLGSERNGRFY